MLERLGAESSRSLGPRGGRQLQPFDALQDRISFGYSPEDQDEDGGFNPLSLLIFIVRYRWLIAGIVIGCLAAGMMITLLLTPLYRATTQVEVSAPNARVFQDLEVISESADLRAYYTAIEKLRSRAIARAAVFELNLARNEKFLFPIPDFSIKNVLDRAFGLNLRPSLDDFDAEERERMAVNRVMRNLSVDLVRNTSVVTVSYSDPDPQMARDIANQVVQSYVDQRADQKGEASDLVRQFIQEQVAEVKTKLQASEEALVTYAAEVGITVTGEEGSLIQSNIRSINTALSKAVEERLLAERRVEQIESGNAADLPQVLENEVVRQTRLRLADLKAEYQQKLGSFKPGFPEMRRLQAQIDELQRQIDQIIASISVSIGLQYQDAAKNEEALREELKRLEEQQASYDQKNIKYTILKREVESNRSQYQSLIDKLNEAGVGSEINSSNASIIDFAVVPEKPYSPKLLINLAISLVLAGGLSSIVIYLLELLNNTFSTPDQVERELRLPVFGVTPLVDADLPAELADMRSGLSEAYRSLRTSLQFSTPNGTPHTILVTSAEPGEGKSTTARTLAVDFATLGMKVLLVDADMRRPSQHRAFGMGNTIGLSNYLTSTLPSDDRGEFFRSTPTENLTFVAAGPLPPNPVDLLSSANMGAFVHNATQNFDLVIIDGPPIIGLSDALLLSRLCEATLAIVSAHQVARKSVQAALKRLSISGGHVIGVAMTKFQIKKLEYNYAYQYLNYNYAASGGDARLLPGGGKDERHGRGTRARALLRSLGRRFAALGNRS